jgi:hypothetical protein
MTPEQRIARNEAFQLVAIAERILRDAGLVAYADDASALVRNMKMDNDMLREQFLRQRNA